MEDDVLAFFTKHVPEILQTAQYREEVERWFERELDRVSDDDIENQFDVFLDAFFTSAQKHLSLAWDGDAPGMSGAIYFYGLDDFCLVHCSDRGYLGFFSDLSEALAIEELHIMTAKPELNSDFLGEEEMLRIAENLVDEESWSDSILINNQSYQLNNGRLIRRKG